MTNHLIRDRGWVLQLATRAFSGGNSLRGGHYRRCGCLVQCNAPRSHAAINAFPSLAEAAGEGSCSSTAPFALRKTSL